MRYLTLMTALLVTLTACGEDVTTGDGGSAGADVALDGDASLTSDTTSDGTALSDTISTDSMGGCMCMVGYKCVNQNGQFTCVPDSDTASGDGTGGNLTCTQVGQCIETACQANPQPCGLSCSAGAGPGVAAKLDALTTCIAQKCQAGMCKGNVTTQCMNECSGSQCGSVLFDCFEDNQPGGNACKTAIDCFGNCDKSPKDNHFACMSKCYTGLTLLGKTQLKAFTDCLAKTDGGTAGFAQCQAEYTACATGGETGTGSCVDISKCQANCAASSSSCPSECLSFGTKTAQQEASDLQACFLAHQADPYQCFGKLETCAAPTGTGKCNAIQKCIDTCKTGFKDGDDKGSCTVGCLHSATKPAADAFVAIYACVIPNCASCLKGDSGCQSCLEAQCKPQLDTCLAN